MIRSDDIEGFGLRLKSIRKRHGLSQQTLATAVRCSRGYISSLETGSFSPSMAILRKLSAALNVQLHELLYCPTEDNVDAIPVINTTDSPQLTGIAREPVDMAARESLTIPGVMGRSAFAAFLPDDSMAPDFGKGDLVVFSLTQPGTDGAACLVDTGKGVVVFRTALALPGRAWRLQPSNPRYEPMVIRATKAVRMWPVIGRWQALPPRLAR